MGIEENVERKGGKKSMVIQGRMAKLRPERVQLGDTVFLTDEVRWL